MAMDAESLPIDIHTGKLLDWLISRRHVNKDWQKSIGPIREKINAALEDMPEHKAIVQLLSKSSINYFHCRKIVEILKETEAESKNIFGRYSSQRMKDWQEVVTLYETNCIYLAEASQILQRYVSYEIPATKKQIAKCKATVEESARKEVEYGKLAKEADRVFLLECEKMKISSNNIRRELLTLSGELTSFFTHIVKQLRSLRGCCDFYIAFRASVLKRELEPAEVLQMIQLIIDKGDITHYEYFYGQKPERIEPMFRIDDPSDTADSTEDKIDFGAGDEVDFDYSSIDFDSETAIIELNDISQSEAVQQPGGIASGLESLSVLEHRETQQQLLAELYELEAFLKTRLFEMESNNAAELLLGGGSNVVDPKIAAVINRSTKELRQMLADVREMLSEMTDSNRRHLFKIRVSPNYVNCLVEELEQKKAQGDKYRRMAKLMSEKQVESQNEAADLQKDLDVFVEKTRELQKQIESEISKKYKNRPVNIMGGITAALASA